MRNLPVIVRPILIHICNKCPFRSHHPFHRRVLPCKRCLMFHQLCNRRREPSCIASAYSAPSATPATAICPTSFAPPPDLPVTWCMALRVGKLASLLAVTVTPQKDINIRLPVGGPYKNFLGGLSRSSWFFLEVVAMPPPGGCARGGGQWAGTHGPPRSVSARSARRVEEDNGSQ